MTREDAKAILKNCLDKAEYKHGAYGIALDMAIKALEQKDLKFYYDHGYAQAKRDLQEPKTGHWIPVSERLPEINDDVLISLEWGIDIGRYSDGEWCSEWINNYDDGNVLAWMPLPKPYKPQESEGTDADSD